MPDLIDNCAGISTVTGTAHYLISNSTGRHRNLVDVLTDSQIVSYYACPVSSGVSGFEQGTAIWRDSTNTLEVQTITNSSNGGGKVAWGAGDKVVYIVAPETAYLRLGTTAATAAAGDDPRFGSVDIDSLTPSGLLTGAEVFPASRAGGGIKIPASLINDVRKQYFGNGLNRQITFESGAQARRSESVTTTDTAYGSTGLTAFMSGTGSPKAYNLATLIGASSPLLNTGNLATSWVALQSDSSSTFLPTASCSGVVTIQTISTLPNAAGQTYTLQVGIRPIGTITALATRGIYFECLPTDSNQLFACVRSTANPTYRIGTGFTLTAVQTILGYEYDSVLEQTRFFVNGTLVVTVPNATSVYDNAAAGFEGSALTVSVFKTAGTTPQQVAVSGFYGNWSAPSKVGY